MSSSTATVMLLEGDELLCTVGTSPCIFNADCGVLVIQTGPNHKEALDAAAAVLLRRGYNVAKKGDFIGLQGIYYDVSRTK